MRLGLGNGLGKAGGTMSGVMGGPVPVNTVAPAISGTARVGQTLTTTNGTWDNAPSSYTYQWTRNGSNISGATSSTYLTVVADMGTLVRCVVTAINAGGPSLPATSNSIDIFNYDDISGLAVWLDAWDASTVQRDTGSSFVPALDGEAVARWVDKSTNGHILAQIVAGSRPSLSTSNGPSGGRAINFDGANDFLLKASLIFDFPCTVFTVMRQNSFTTSDMLYETRGAGNRPLLIQRVAAGQIRGPFDSPAVSHTLSTWNLVTQKMSASVNTLQIDGGTVNSGTAGASSGAGSLTIGATNLGLNSWCHVDFAAFIAYSRVLTDPEIATVQATLKSIYGTP